MKYCRLIAAFFCLLAVTSQPASAQIFLQLDGMTGSVEDTNHLGWMAINSIQQGVGRSISTPTGSGSRRDTSAPSFSEFVVSKLLDSASPQLALHAAGGGGNVINSGTLDMVRVDSSLTRYVRLNLTNILISSYSLAGGGDVPSESISLAPLIVSWNYTLYRTTTGLPKTYAFNGWDLSQNTGATGTNSPVFVGTGIRKTNGVELRWAATAGRLYRIFAVPALTQPFLPVAQLTATTTGNTNYNFTPAAPAMFYTVEEVPAGY